MKNQFYFEATMIEYAVIEDKVDSLFSAHNCKIKNKLKQNLETMKTSHIFNEKFIHERITIDLIEKIDEWRMERNSVVHDLFKEKILEVDFKNVAEQGFEPQRILDNKVSSINRHYKRLAEKSEKNDK